MIDRRFWATDGRRAEFEAALGAGGPRSKLLYQADGYLLTEVWCESLDSSHYRAKDVSSRHRNFEVFRARFHAELEQFQNWLRSEGLVEREQFLGAYYQKSEGGDEEDWVFELEAKS